MKKAGDHFKTRKTICKIQYGISSVQCKYGAYKNNNQLINKSLIKSNQIFFLIFINEIVFTTVFIVAKKQAGQ